MLPVLPPRYRMPLCPYLMVGNRRLLVHLDAYGVPQSLQWPSPGAPDRLGWRDPFDEWPYWEELEADAIRAHMPYVVSADGARAGLHEAETAAAGYLGDTNILAGRYRLPGGITLEMTTFVPPSLDVWVRQFRVRGTGRFVLQGEFFEKAVRSHALAHLGDIPLRGAFEAAPRGAYVLCATVPLTPHQGRVEFPLEGETDITLFLACGRDLKDAARIAEEAERRGFEALREETAREDGAWLARAREPVAAHPFVRRHFKRWLLSNQLLFCEDGAMVCGPRPFWSFVWPRDASQHIVAFAEAGYLEEARRAVRWLLDRTPESGVHEARYRSDGTPMLLDNRPRQGDNPGFLCWAAGEVARRAWDPEWVAAIRDPLVRMTDHLIRDCDPETRLPLPEADHRESQVSASIGIVVTAFGGLHGAADLFERLGEADRAQRCRARAAEIRQAAETHLWNEHEQYFLTSVNPRVERSDIATAWGVYPFEVWPAGDPKSAPAIARLVRDRWNAAAGGVLAAPGTPYESYWMYYTTKLLLGVAGIGDRALEREILDALERASSPQGMVPEQIGRASGNLWGCAPLPTAHAALLLYAYHAFPDGSSGTSTSKGSLA